MKKRNISNILVIDAYIILVFLALRKFIFNIGATLGHNWDWSIPNLPSQLRSIYYYSSYLWSEYNLGSVRLWGNTSMLFNKLLGLFGFINVGGNLLSKGLVFFVIVISAYGMYKLLLDLLRDDYGSNPFVLNIGTFLGGFFYGFSPYLFCDFIGGANTQFFTYAIYPYGFMFVRRYIVSGKFHNLICSSIFLSLITFSFQRLFLFFVISGLYIIFVLPVNRLVVKRLFFLGVLFLLINLYWIVPLIIELKYSVAYMSIKELGYCEQNIKESVPSLTQIFVGTGYFRPFFNIVIARKRLWILCSHIAILTIFYSIIRFAKKRESAFWLGLFLLSLPFTTGGKAPLGGFVLWLYKYMPIMSLFRSPQHLIIIPTFCLSIIIAFGIFYLWDYYIKFRNRAVNAIFFISFFYLIIIWVGPFLKYGDLGSDFLKRNFKGGNFIDGYSLSPGYKSCENILNKLNTDCRLLPLPMTTSPYYLKTGYQSEGQGGDPYLISMSTPSVTSDFISDLRKEYANLIETEVLTERRFRTFVNLVRLIGVKYILLRSDVIPLFGDRKKIWDINNIKDFLDKLKKRDWTEKIFSGDYVSLYELKDVMPMIYAPCEIYKVSGAFKVIAELFNFISTKSDKMPMFLWGKSDNCDDLRLSSVCNIHTAHLFKNEPDDIAPDIFKMKTVAGKYLLTASIESVPYILEKKEWGWRYKFTEKSLSEWLRKTVNIKWYLDKHYDRGIKLSVLFDGAGEEDEYIQMKYEGVYFDLKEYPYFNLRYRTQSTSKQIIEVILGLDFNNDRVTDGYTRGIYAKSGVRMKLDFTCNIYNIAKGLYPDKESYNVTSIELYPHKLWREDCSANNLNRYYRFWIDSIGFYKPCVDKEPYFKKIRNNLDIKGLDNNKKTYIKKSGKFVYLFFPTDGVDIKRFPYVKFKYKISEVVANIEFAVYVTDKRGDIKRIPMGAIPNFWKEEGEYEYNLLNRLSVKGYYVGNNYLLEKVEFKFILSDAKKLGAVQIDDLINLKRLQIYSKILIPKRKFIFRKCVLEIDKDRLLFKKNNFNRKGVKESYIFQNIMDFNRGEHVIRNLLLDNPNSSCKWVMLSPLKESDGQVNPPNISYNKLNPCRYEVYLDNIHSPFWLVFGQAYNPAWHAYIIDGDEKVLIQEHFIANGYANGWFIAQDKSEKLKIIIEYIPQRWFLLSSIFSGGVLFVGIVLLWVLSKRSK